MSPRLEIDIPESKLPALATWLAENDGRIFSSVGPTYHEQRPHIQEVWTREIAKPRALLELSRQNYQGNEEKRNLISKRARDMVWNITTPSNYDTYKRKSPKDINWNSVVDRVFTIFNEALPLNAPKNLHIIKRNDKEYINFYHQLNGIKPNIIAAALEYYGLVSGKTVSMRDLSKKHSVSTSYLNEKLGIIRYFIRNDKELKLLINRIGPEPNIVLSQ